ncbi:hypothetical protein ACNHKD_09860 [Methylocystis sp. JAN1]|uniref:hypothetical protein n=1 Tax=Methylocystis sp. JAN1 TaxID=3397211 RepID=UPI003FA1CC10
MGLWGFLSGKRRASANPAIAELAGEIERRLEALGLFVQARPHGTGFVEIRASTSAGLITTPGALGSSGVALLLAGKYEPPALVFEQINSVAPGLGGRMVGAVMDALRARPGVLARVKVNDLSPLQKDGRRWWEHMAARHADVEWRITHDPDATHWPAPAHLAEDNIPRTPDFLRKQEKLRTLAREFGCDPARVALSPEKKIFDFLGQSFVSEGEATADGRVTVYYDPQMSDARLGCCLAHELQHLRYFAVRDAYNAEPPDGPLHRRFQAFTPQRLAAQRGVSNYSNEHWDAWAGVTPPRLFSDELAEGGSEPINETIAEVAKALYNWGPEVRLNPVWRELREAVDAAYATLKD